MHERYDYVTVRGRRDSVHTALDSLRDAGITVWGTWAGAGGIGWYDDEFVVVTTDGTIAESHFAGVDVGAMRPVVATARPTSPTALAPGGVFAHRWFEFAADDWDEFLSLSTEAWPSFESQYGATIEGFFRLAEVDDPDRGSAVLVTRYPSLAAWETSRQVIRPDSVAPDAVAEAASKFMRRRELTQRTVVRVGLLLTR